MRTIIKFLAVAFLAYTISLIINTESKAQGKKDDPTVTQINTGSPMFELIIGGDSQESTAMRILITDRVRQYVAMENARLRAMSKESDPQNYWVRLIHAPEIGPLVFKQAETMDENILPIDGIKVISVRFKEIESAQLVWYP